MKTAPIVVCTLWEGDYHKGLGALVNSLVRAGFAGMVWAGYRGVLPPWVSEQPAEDGSLRMTVAPGVVVAFVPVSTTMHFSQYKPDFCLQVLNGLDPECGGVYYFDPDVMILCRWSFFEEWIQAGIAVCEDGHYPLSPNHPLVATWVKYAHSLGMELTKPISAYVNSGLMGVTRERASFLELWREILQAVQRDFQLAGQAHFGSRVDPFHNIDQDAFTLALAITSLPVSIVGTDGMGFDRGEWLTLHATGKKPWRRRIFMDLVRQGVGPGRALRWYWQLAWTPIAVEPVGRVRRHRLWIPLAALLARFYGKPA